MDVLNGRVALEPAIRTSTKICCSGASQPRTTVAFFEPHVPFTSYLLIICPLKATLVATAAVASHRVAAALPTYPGSLACIGRGGGKEARPRAVARVCNRA